MKTNTQHDSATRITISFGVLAGVAMILYFWVVNESVGVDFRVYYYVVRDWLVGNSVYGVNVGSYPMAYLYSPLVLVIFLPFVLFQTWTSGFVFLIVIQISAAVVASKKTVSFLRSKSISLTYTDSWLIFLFVIGSSITIGGLRNGNINVLLLSLVSVAAILIYEEREYEASILLFFASIFKIYLAFFGLWFILHKKWRAVKISLLLGISGVLASLSFGIGLNIAYIDAILNHSGGKIEEVGMATRTVSLQQLMQGFIPLSSAGLIALSLCLVLIVVFSLSKWSVGLSGEMYLLFWIFATPNLVSPKEMLEYVVIPLVLLLYTVSDSVEYYLLAGGSVLILLTIGQYHFNRLISLLPISSDSPPIGLIDILLSVGSFPLYGIGLILVSSLYHMWRVHSTKRGHSASE